MCCVGSVEIELKMLLGWCTAKISGKIPMTYIGVIEKQRTFARNISLDSMYSTPDISGVEFPRKSLYGYSTNRSISVILWCTVYMDGMHSCMQVDDTLAVKPGSH